ncbi:MAG: hypothetical protein B7Y38_11480 [Sphingomonadales bacterium 28-56-43]|nr:MAG: hypothetical protein B7Y38_11480 [Sphingomonadales bacterium 28-56-43]OZA36634.1 MAG: hypothetical protein B7X92_05855 [Novosphingobium sp. 17-62-9]HQS96692.1 hypothetical protein [Novosphingobium sp.]
MAQVKNISTGPRGAYLAGVLVMAEKGAIIEADDFAEEWFEEVGGDDEADLAKMTVAQLKAFAEANDIDLGDAEKKADILSAIELATETNE